ncbi:hypothetical protein DY000_02012644 [Brassica cretica]|uniref:Neprosin domain-containing protein n=1 Tax=Brassica cretica TaxID=69181 RepID=A0ABQ7DAT9_BRACR|nr:hypothetical protein DY000_02012644 [Brassica cretica]
MLNVENVRWPSGSTERFSHTTTRGRQFDTQGQRGGTGLAKKSLRGFLARWPFGVSPVTIKSSTHKVFENVRWPSGSTERFSHTTTRGRQFDTQGQRGGTGLAKKSLRGFLARWPFGICGSGSGFDGSNILLSGFGFCPSGYPDFWIGSGSDLGSNPDLG